MLFARRKSMWIAVLFALLAPLALAQVTINGESGSPPPAAEPEALPEIAAPPLNAPEPLGERVQALKQSVLDLNRDLLILEEELLFPANTQIAIFLSMDVGEFFQLDAVEVRIDDELVASSLYTPAQADALFRGGVQRIYVGNLKSGSHVVTAFFTGKGPQGREYKRGATTIVEKALTPKMLELQIIDSTRKLQPVFDIKEWES